ncbi:MAG: hypothetical protein IPL61_28225 [Myxococcales bacterium]|nr:hypothetical protein [Myxococcales bacterium]
MFNLQRDPDTGEMFAIGKSDRPYSFAEVQAAEQEFDRGDPATVAVLIDVDLELDRYGVPLPPEQVAAVKKRARLVGWPAQASGLRRKHRWERERALRRPWRSVGYGRHPDAPEPAPTLAAVSTRTTGAGATAAVPGPVPTPVPVLVPAPVPTPAPAPAPVPAPPPVPVPTSALAPAPAASWLPTTEARAAPATSVAMLADLDRYGAASGGGSLEV